MKACYNPTWHCQSAAKKWLSIFMEFSMEVFPGWTDRIARKSRLGMVVAWCMDGSC